MKRLSLVYVVILSLLVSTGCNKVTYKKTPGGMPYKVFRGDSKDTIRVGDILKIFVTQKLNDSISFSNAGQLPMYLKIRPEKTPYDISEIWTKLHANDSVVSIQMLDTFINRNPMNIDPKFKKGDKITTYLKILAVFSSDSVAQEDEKLSREQFLDKEIKVVEEYVKSKNPGANKTPSGAFIQILTPGSGNLIDTGNYVTMNYTGTTFSGVKFDSNVDTTFGHPDPYSFTAGNGEMIRGFDEGILMMRNGSKAMIYIPSMLGYGSTPNSPNIKPYENLVFEVEIIDVKDKKPADN